MSQNLIQALQNPAVFDHPVTEFRLIQTHISWVLLTGEFAYKIKKPMNFGFLDFSTLDKRKFYCGEELRLNSRTAPELYLDVVAITGTETAPQVNGAGEVFEYAVKMRQFDPENNLEKLLGIPAQLASHLDRLADQIAEFHLHKATPLDPEGELGSAAAVMAPVQQNFEQIRPLLHDRDELAQLDQLEGWANCHYKRLNAILTARQQQGFVRECHGDMHLGNVTLIDNQVTLFDCIEFNDSFRCIDTINDLAFLLMDLDDRNLKGLAIRVLNRYLEQSGDYAGLALLNFYKSYRAMVRCKIALLTLNSPDISDEMRSQETRKYKRYLRLAERYTEVPGRFLMLMHGVSGTGKSTISGHLLEHLGAIRVRSDVERKRLFGLRPLDNSRSELAGGIYSADASERTYQHLATTANHILDAGLPVILDATFLKQSQRTMMEDLAETLGVPFIVVDCQADRDTLKQRIEQRMAHGQDAAEANLKVLDKQLATQEPLTTDECLHVVGITGQNLQALDNLADHLAERLGTSH